VTPSPTPAPQISGDAASLVVCDQMQQTCAVDLDPNATTGEEAAVLVSGITGSLTVTNRDGPSTATISKVLFSQTGASSEYKVIYDTVTTAPGTDVLMIADSGTKSSLTIPVTIESPGEDAGVSFFALDTTSGTVCPGNQVTFGTTTQGNATVVLSTSDPTLISISQDGRGVFILYINRAGSGTVTATAGSSTVIYPANVPAAGFTPNC
jgi:hypothetical protein